MVENRETLSENINVRFPQKIEKEWSNVLKSIGATRSGYFFVHGNP